MTAAIAIRRVTASVYRCPLDAPVTTSFGVMRDRPMVLVEVEDADGARGWGEVWCNFPAVGAEHRARLVDSALASLLTSQTFADPPAAYRRMSSGTEVLSLQCAEPGPFAQAIAGIDIALWDLVARRAGTPLWRLLDASGNPDIGVYASGLNPDAPERLASARQEEGHRVFKLKIGFGRERDIANLQALRATLGAGARLMADANQGWDLATAKAMATAIEPFDLGWLEEPLRANRPWAEWAELASHTLTPLAAGENIAGEAAFDMAIGSGALRVVQPDLAKWGGFSAGLPVARAIRKAGRRYCPHYLGGGIGLLASAHLLAAVGGDGLLEIDSNPNPLRSLLSAPLGQIRDGRVTLPEVAGLGIVPDLAAIERYRVRH
jgi:L-alanine-DL-glutamate epimerase-like enolase superfamily enzyme